MTYEIKEVQVQFFAEIGQVDGGGMGYMDSVDDWRVFPTYEQAEEWLTQQGWVYSERALRRVKTGHPYGLARTRRLEVADKSLWQPIEL